MQNSSQDIRTLSAAFIDVQKSYVHEVLYTGNEKPPRFTQEKIVHFTINNTSFELTIIPTFKLLQSEFSFRESTNVRFNSDRECNLLLKIYKLPIKKIEVIHTIEDPSLKDSIDKAEGIANDYFFNANLTYLDYLKSFFHIL